jgi:surfactin synthase thioesterase subunit
LTADPSPKPLFFILAHAVGSGRHYVEALKGLSGKVDLFPLDLPGHGSREGEPPLRTMDAIVADLLPRAEAAQRPRGGPYYVFGHSMGGFNAFLLAFAMAGAGLGPARRFFVSSNSVPGWHPLVPGMSKLPELELWQESARRFGVFNNKPLPTPDQMRRLTPAYRADMEAVAAYRLPDPRPVLGSPITAFYTDDDIVDLPLMEAWEGFTTRSLEIIKLLGGHFHPLERPGQLVDAILPRL